MRFLLAPGRKFSAAGGALVVVAMRWTDRLIGLVSTVILARLLAPEDFGLIAMAMLVIGLVDVLLDLGVNVALIRNRDATQAHYDTAWTLRLLQTVVGAVIVVSCASYAARYFGDSRVQPVMWVLAASLLLSGIENIGIVTFQKEMRFGKDFQFLFAKRMVGFIVTIAAAWWLRSYWALVIGTLSLRLFGVILSYRMHEMRPRLSLDRAREIFSISQWVLLNSIGQYLNSSVHKILVGRRADATVLGGYTLADEISALPSTELLAPLNRVLFPAYVQARDDPDALKRKFLLAQGVQCLLGIPAGIGLSLVAHEAVALLLGEQWLMAVPFVQVLAVANVLFAISSSAGYLMLSSGRVSLVALVTWAQVIVFIVAVGALMPDAGADQIVWLRACSIAIGAALMLYVVVRAVDGLRYVEVIACLIRPTAAAVCMSAAVAVIDTQVVLPLLGMLTVKVFAGAVAYLVPLLLLWRLAGRPDGAERYLLTQAAAICSRLIGKRGSPKSER